MSYQKERDEFINRMSREGLPLEVTRALLRAATTLQRYAELACSSEAADRDRVPCPAAPRPRHHGRGHVNMEPGPGPCLCDDYPAGSHANGLHSDVPRITVQADRLERRIVKVLGEVNRVNKPIPPATRIDPWQADFQGDPRGYVLRVIPPSYAERNAGKDRYNLDTIGVPSAPSRLRF